MTPDQTQGTTWPTDAEREALRRCRSFAAGNAFGVPVEAQEQHLEYVLDALAEHVARREREAAARALREAADDSAIEATWVPGWLHARANRIQLGGA